MAGESIAPMHKMCALIVVLLTTQQAHGFSTPKTPLTTTQSLAHNIRAAWNPRTPSVLFMSEESDGKEPAPVVEEPEDDETEATTTGLFIPGFSDQVEVAPEPPAKKQPEPPKKKEEPKKSAPSKVTKEEAISKAESVISEASKAPSDKGAGFKVSNPFANKTEKTQAPTPPTPPKVEKKLGDKDVSPLDLTKLVRGETTAKAVVEKAQQKQVVPAKSDGPSIPSLPKISLPFQKPKTPTPPPPPVNNDPISSAIGGALTGAALGLYTNVATDFLYDTDLPPIVPPAALGVAIAATAYTGANQPNFVGKISSFIFGGPVRSVKNFFVKKVEDTVDNIKATPGRIVKSVEDKIDQTVEDIKATPGKIVDAIEDKIEETVDEIKATPGKIADGIERKVEETVKDIEEKVEEVVSLPGKKLDELSESLGIKSESKSEVPRPPPVDTLPSEPKKSFLPPPDAKLSLPSLSLPKIPEAEKKPVPPTPPKPQSPSLEIPKISIPKVQVSLPVSLPEKPKTVPPPPSKKEEPKLPSLSLPSISVPKPPQPKLADSTTQAPPKPAKKKNDPYVFTEAALKEYIQKDKPAVTELDKQQEEERKRREVENAKIAERAGPLFPEKDTEAKTAPVVVKSTPIKKRATLSVPKIAPSATKAPPNQQDVVKVPPVKGRPTFSLFGMGGAPAKADSTPAAPVIAKTTPAAKAPRGVPTISKWKFNPSDNSVSGFISGSSAFKDGEPVTTSAIVGDASSNTVVRIKSGSRYFLGEEETSRGGGGIFGFLGGGRSSEEKSPAASPATDSNGKAVDTLAVRMEAQRKRDEEAAARKAEQEVARKRAIEEAAAKREQQALARKQADEERRRIAEEQKAIQDEARRKAQEIAAEKQEARQRAAEEARVKREKLAEEKRLAREKALQKSQPTSKVVVSEQQESNSRPAEPRPTFSLFGLGGGATSEPDAESVAVKPQPVTTAPRGLPTISKWTLNNDNTISGFITGSSSFKNGDPVTTSAIVDTASSNAVVRTKSGSRYFLGEEATSGGGVFSLFGSKSPTLSVKQESAQETASDKAAAQAEARKKAEEAKAKQQAAVEEKKRLQEEAQAKRAADAAAKQAAIAEKKRLAEEAKAKQQAAVEEKKRLQAEAQAKRAADAAAKQAAIAEKKRLAEEAKAKQQKKQQAEKAVSSASRGVTISLFGFGQKSDDTESSSATSAAPSGIPTISRWRQERDGSITGIITGSPSFKNGDPITTSPIRGKAIGGSIVTTKSGSRYFLSEGGTAPTKPAASKSNDAAKARQLAAKKAEEKKQQLAAQAAEKRRLAEERKAQAEERERIAAEKKAAELAKKKQEQAAKAKAQSVVSQAKRGSTISLFGLGQGADESQSTPTPVQKSPTLQVQKSTKSSAPKGVPTISGWKLNGDGSISGRISGSPNFKNGELITTSQIQKGRIESGSVVQTGSGSRYFLG